MKARWNACSTALVRQADIQLARIAAYPGRERLTELTLDPPDATSGELAFWLARRGLPDPVHHPPPRARVVGGTPFNAVSSRLHVRPRHRQRYELEGDAPALGDDARGIT